VNWQAVEKPLAYSLWPFLKVSVSMGGQTPSKLCPFFLKGAMLQLLGIIMPNRQVKYSA